MGRTRRRAARIRPWLVSEEAPALPESAAARAAPALSRAVGARGGPSAGGALRTVGAQVRSDGTPPPRGPVKESREVEAE